jgi:FKBP-type peptidyl-prolyl cis-trans isomerase FkpA
MKKSFLTALAVSILSTAAISAHAQSNTVPGLPAGMSVQIEKQGTGAQPVATDRVTVNYVGTLANGTVFDSSYKRGTPASFSLDQVVPCWTIGLQKLKVGGKAKLVCPPETAYGNHDVGGGLIPANSTLTFEVELLGIVK